MQISDAYFNIVGSTD